MNVSAPVDVARLLADGSIAKGGGAGGSDPGRGLVDVTADQVEYVLRFDPVTGRARFAFRLAADASTLTGLNWNADAVLTQTPVGDSLP
ncbi:MAG: hypothetical protein K6V73_12795 [Firmicutes bacterium]|nr:hypothetical protein [Bacillota bacterium]